jgi:Uma2 family endonuclease
MSAPAARQRPITIEEYLALEASSAVRHEYVAGEVYAMTGATKRHNLLLGNIATRLRIAAAGGPCRVFTESVKVRAGRNIIYYADVMVACGPDGGDPLVEDAPCLIVEVLSPSTESIDWREKALVYKDIPSLRSYAIVYQDSRRVERWSRDERGDWWHSDVAERGLVPLPCPEPGLEMTLDEIYRGAEPGGG